MARPSRRRLSRRSRRRRSRRYRGGAYIPLNPHTTKFAYPEPGHPMRGGSALGIQPLGTIFDNVSYGMRGGYHAFMGNSAPVSPNPWVQNLTLK